MAGCPWKLSPTFRVDPPPLDKLIKKDSQVCPAASLLVDFRSSQVDKQDYPSYLMFNKNELENRSPPLPV